MLESAIETADSFDQFNQVEPPVAATSANRTFVMSADRIKYLRKDQINMTKQDPTHRSFSKEFAEKLSKSLESEGLIHPPLAVDLGNGSYQVRNGRHRCFSCFNLLKWETMPFTVISDGPDDLAEAIEIAANLFSNPLNESQTRLAVQKWHEIYLKTHSRKTRDGDEAKNDGFAAEIKSTLGVSKRQAHRMATTAKNISAEDRATLEASGVPQNQIDKIAEIRDPEQISAAVNLAASGMPVAEAVSRGKKAKKEKVEKAASDAGKPAKEDKRAKPPELTDDEWLATHCKKLVEALPFKNAFKRDAILYRRIIENLGKFRTATKKALAEAKKPGENGLFYASLFKVVNASHPMNWLICEKCNGKGHAPETKDKPCGGCLGGGFKLKFENT